MGKRVKERSKKDQIGETKIDREKEKETKRKKGKERKVTEKEIIVNEGRKSRFLGNN